MNIAELKQLGAIYLETVTDGLRNFPNEIQKLDADEAYEILAKRCEKQNWEDVYADFYYHTFDSEVKQKIEENLEAEEVEYIQRMCMPGNQEELIFPLDEILLRIIVKLNASEILFSTIYFVNEHRSTWWGNYNKEYVVFTDK